MVGAASVGYDGCHGLGVCRSKGGVKVDWATAAVVWRRKTVNSSAQMERGCAFLAACGTRRVKYSMWVVREEE